MPNKCLLFILLFIIFPLTARAGFNEFLTNKYVLKWGWYSSIVLANAMDGMKDGYYWHKVGQKEGDTYLINDSNWHIPKNVGRLAFVLAGASLFTAKAKKQITWKGLMVRAFAGGLISYTAWRVCYTKVRWNDWWDTTIEHNQHIVWYPDIRSMEDKYISMKDNQVGFFLGGMGLFGFSLACHF